MMKTMVAALALTGLALASAIQTTPNEPLASVATTPNSSSALGTTGVMATSAHARELPDTSSALPLIALAAVGSIGLAFSVMFIRRRVTAAAR